MNGKQQARVGSSKARLTLALLAGTAAICATGAEAATTDATAPQAEPAGAGVSEVIVTARKVEEDAQRVPLTVTAVSPTELKQQNITDIYDLTYAVPSLTVGYGSGNSLLPIYAVRGLSTGVATYFSEAPGGDANVPFVDVSQVQVLNGPQGTLFGRSSAAGAILVTPTHPDLDNLGGSLDAIVGDYGRLQGTAVANIPLVAGELGLRLVVNADHVNGYTQVTGTDQYLDEINNQQARVGLEFKKGGFDNYLVGSYLNVNQSANSKILTAGTLFPPELSGLYQLPAELGAAFGPVLFGGTCATAVKDGFASTVGGCESQHAALFTAVVTDLQAQIARAAAGGSAATRSVSAPFGGLPQFAREEEGGLVDIAQYDFGAVGPVQLSLKNIFSFGASTNNSSGGNDGRILNAGGYTTGALTSVVGSDNYVGTTVLDRLSPPVEGYSNDFQIHADTAEKLLTSVVGVYYGETDYPTDLAGVANLYQEFSGSLNVDLGYGAATGFSGGGYGRESAVYTQETLDLSRWVHGLSLTGGYRYSWDSSLIKMFAATYNYNLPGFVPGTPGTLVPGAESGTGTSSSGYNYTAQAAEQVNPDWMIYGSVNRAYVPGGVNLLGQTATSLPNYTPTYQPELVLEEEVGTKFNLNVGSFHSQIGANVYNNDFTNIVEPLVGYLAGAAESYSENVAAAYLRGAEVYGTIIPAADWEIRFSYDYNEAHFTKWIGSDPDGAAKPGNALCLPPASTTACYLNLANNPFPLMPSQQAHITLVYHAPIPSQLGRLALSAAVYGQTREYYATTAARDLQVFEFVGGDPKIGLNAVSEAPYATLNLRADWQNAAGSGFDVSAFVDNATNTTYKLGEAEVLYAFGTATATYAPPIMFGFEVSRKFGPGS